MNINEVTEPSAADLAEIGDVEIENLTAADWEALLEPVIVPESAEDWWSDEAPEDERYSGTGVPSWSAWA